jgi:hypothetical protein
VLSAVLDTANDDFAHAATSLHRVTTASLMIAEWPMQQIADLLNQGGRIAAQADAANLTAAYTEVLKKLPAQASLVSTSDLVSVENSKRECEAGRYLSAGQLLAGAANGASPDPLAKKQATNLLDVMQRDRATTSVVEGLAFFCNHLQPLAGNDAIDQGLATLAQDQALLQNFNSARATADSLSVRNPDLGAIAQHKVEFLKRRAALDDSDVLSRYELGAWARTMGLLDDAESILGGLRRDPRFTENVNIQLELIRTQRAQQAIADIKKEYDSGSFSAAEASAKMLLATSPPREFAQKAQEYIQLVKFYRWNHGRADAGKAEATFQQAERLTNTGHYQDAIEQLNRIEIDSAGTAPANRAAKLRDKIKRIQQYDAMVKRRQDSQ